MTHFPQKQTKVGAATLQRSFSQLQIQNRNSHNLKHMQIRLVPHNIHNTDIYRSNTNRVGRPDDGPADVRGVGPKHPSII